MARRHRGARRIGLLVLLLVTAAPATRAAGRPNIVFIMTDGHAAHAIGGLR